MRANRLIIIAALLIATALVLLVAPRVQRRLSPKSVEERLQEYGPAARIRLWPGFGKARIDYPPKRLVLIGIKAEKQLQVYAANATGSFRFIRSYPILAASGQLGPKLREGDRQVPEGVYPVESLNPNSRFHLALRVGYPNTFDRTQARAEGRTNLGGDIMIHGNAVSIGCLAMGDPAAEDLFVLAADTGLKNIVIVLTPVDFRAGVKMPPVPQLPAWTTNLYESIRSELTKLPVER